MSDHSVGYLRIQRPAIIVVSDPLVTNARILTFSFTRSLCGINYEGVA
jgi:hypothetical protein